jgi:hypothetical protein
MMAGTYANSKKEGENFTAKHGNYGKKGTNVLGESAPVQERVQRALQ